MRSRSYVPGKTRISNVKSSCTVRIVGNPGAAGSVLGSRSGLSADGAGRRAMAGSKTNRPRSVEGLYGPHDEARHVLAGDRDREARDLLHLGLFGERRQQFIVAGRYVVHGERAVSWQAVHGRRPGHDGTAACDEPDEAAGRGLAVGVENRARHAREPWR